jgi:Asp-tRNA(Asn)/Glu-tRNA(Gln) amidotransferase C subunit
MPDLTKDEMLQLAKIAGISIVPEDVDELTLRLNAILEVLPPLLDSMELDGIDGVRPLPALMHPIALPS